MTPRCINRRQAADYCGCGSLSAFDDWGRRGIVPGPRASMEVPRRPASGSSAYAQDSQDAKPTEVGLASSHNRNDQGMEQMGISDDHYAAAISKAARICSLAGINLISVLATWPSRPLIALVRATTPHDEHGLGASPSASKLGSVEERLMHQGSRYQVQRRPDRMHEGGHTGRPYLTQYTAVSADRQAGVRRRGDGIANKNWKTIKPFQVQPGISGLKSLVGAQGLGTAD
jgi:hypothetical protein